MIGLELGLELEDIAESRCVEVIAIGGVMVRELLCL